MGTGRPDDAAMREVLAYARAQRTTGFLVLRDGETLAERNWPLPGDAAAFQASWIHGSTPEGALIEDVASLQKSLVGLLAAIAADRGLLDVGRPVSDYLGAGWSRAATADEARIRVLHLLTMSSGLDDGFAHAAPPGTRFHYNTPVYAATKAILAQVAGLSLEALTGDWLTGPAGLAETGWRARPAAFGDVGNPTGLVTSPRDLARVGRLILDGGVAQNSRRVVSEAGLNTLFERSPTNPAYGWLWWLNGSAFTIRADGERREGPLVPAAPAGMVAALGAMGRKLYIVPDRRLVVVRLGQAVPDPDFDQQLWTRLSRAL
ncbi:MAG: beta-lactamase family protein [Caulobacteraceae bacterium]|nr:beta-lactamase family protein [Caulobacteraceae bacterium]